MMVPPPLWRLLWDETRTYLGTMRMMISNRYRERKQLLR